MPAYQNPALAADGIYLRRGRVLLIRRGRPPFRGSWALPGGFVELRETVEEAVVRELREETGLKVRPVALVGVYSGPERDPRKPTTSVAFRVTGRWSRAKPGDDAAETEWHRLDRLPPLAFDHARMIADALRLERRRAR